MYNKKKKKIFFFQLENQRDFSPSRPGDFGPKSERWQLSVCDCVGGFVRFFTKHSQRFRQTSLRQYRSVLSACAYFENGRNCKSVFDALYVHVLVEPDKTYARFTLRRAPREYSRILPRKYALVYPAENIYGKYRMYLLLE